MRTLALLLIAAALTGCASRSVPVAFPPSSAASATAAPAPRANVTTALSSDPPLPGEDISSWTGLETDGGSPDESAASSKKEGHSHAHR
jgi:predicted small lipoprotein YifL